MALLNPDVNFLNLSLFRPERQIEITHSFYELLGKDAKAISFLVNLIILCALIAYFGITANIINIINFAKQGFDNTVNISLFGIAVSDLCALLAILWLGVCVNPLLQTETIDFAEIEYLTAGWPHYLFARITCMITVYITIERCLCVTIPLKVKHIITKTTTVITVVLIFFTQILTAIPTYYAAYICWKYNSEKNISTLGLCRIDNWNQVEIVTFVLQMIMLGGSFILLIFFTIILVVNIRRKSQWRKSATHEAQQVAISNRDKKLVRMIVLISVILIACFTPGMIGFIGMTIEPHFNMGEKYDNLFWVVWSLIFVFQTVNSSVNIFVYYSMSTKYRVVFNETFAFCRKGLGHDNDRFLEGTDDA